MFKIMAKVKIFEKKVKHQGQGYKVKSYVTVWKVLSKAVQNVQYKIHILVHYTCTS